MLLKNAWKKSSMKEKTCNIYFSSETIKELKRYDLKIFDKMKYLML